MKFRLQNSSRKRQQPIIPRIQIQIRNGQFEIMGLNVWHSYWRDPYHLLLTIPWPAFLILICVFYVAINALFALVYRLGGDCITNARPGSYLDAFFFSVQTLASIGYGAMYPKTIYANIIVTVEAMIGVVGIAVMTGLAFARFSRPTARVMFSRVAVIMRQEGIPVLLFRTANQRRNMILEAQIRVHLVRDEVNKDGVFLRKIHDVELVRNNTPNFSLSWSIMHIINESSPLFGMTSESLEKTQSLLIVSISGIDETVAQVVHARHSYTANDILWNSKFVDIIYPGQDGHRYVDYNRFHDVVPIDEVSQSEL